jgi:menaquinone-dependent protoporphyrinogen oxidase
MTVLIVFGSKYGSTRRIAHHMADVFAQKGLQVEVRTPEQHPDLTQYDGVVIGSSTYAGRWRRSIRNFLRSNGPALAALPVWLFSVGPLGNPPTPNENPKDADLALTSLDARGHGLFAGSLDSTHLSFGDRAVIRALGVPDGDYRNWNRITAWAEEVAADLALTK